MTLFPAFIPAMILALTLTSKAADLPPQPLKANGVKEKHIIPKAIQVQITKRGGKIFDQKLGSLLYNLGISFDEAYFDPFKWESKVAYDFEKLNIPASQKEILLSVRNVLRNWFHFPFKDVKPALQIGKSGYQATLNRFAIVGDEALLRKLGKTDGAVLVLELEVKELNMATESIKLYDLNNPFLGEVGLNGAQMKVAGGAVPLKIRLPFYTRINSDGVPEFEAVGIEQNFDKVDMELKYQKLLTPKIQLTINGVTRDMDKSELEQQLVDLIPKGLVEVRKYLSDFASKDLPRLLNTKAREQLVKAVEETKPLDPPGATTPNPVALQWGLQLKSVRQNEGLFITLDTFVEDPLNPLSKLVAGSNAFAPAEMTTLPKDQFDIGLGIDRGMINRMLQLSFERKLFEKIPLDGQGNKKSSCIQKNVSTQELSDTSGKFLRLLSQPTIVAADWRTLPKPNWGETFAKIHLNVQVPQGTVSGIQEWVLSDKFYVQFDIIVKLKNIDKSGLVIQLWDVDANSIQLDEKFLTFLGRMFKGKVIKSMKEEFASMAEQWRCESTAIPGAIPIPEIFGIKFKVKHLVMESQGQLVLYLEYKE